MSDPRHDWEELIADTVEYLRFYQELGVTSLDPVSAAAPRSTDVTSAPVPAPVPVLLSLGAPALPLPVEPSGGTCETLEAIRADLGDCQRCKLGATRTKLVFGEGSPAARLMFVGEGPGADEDASGRPFVGRAGQLLTKMIEAIGFQRDEVYIANVVKSRPPGNRAPERDEVEACLPFLRRQIAAIHPRLIVTLGNPATQALLDSKVGITRLRGTLHPYPGRPEILLLPTYHPAYLLRNPEKKREAWEDLKKVRDFFLPPPDQGGAPGQ
jgi:uracil-DNA glycosylase family 4